MTTHDIETGTISHGTLRPADLIVAFASQLDALGLGGAEIVEAWELDGKSAYSLQCDALDELTEALEDAAPPGMYFGSLEGDATDYGFWYEPVETTLVGTLILIDGDDSAPVWVWNGSQTFNAYASIAEILAGPTVDMFMVDGISTTWEAREAVAEHHAMIRAERHG